MKKTLIFAMFILLANAAFAQTDNEYKSMITQAEKLCFKNEYKQAAILYSKAFAANGDKGFVNDRYNAACAWSLAGNNDSAFSQLERIATKSGYTAYDILTIDTTLNNLHADSRWNKVCELVKANKEKAEANINKPLAMALDSIFQNDQQGRMRLAETEKKYGRDSKEMKDLWKNIEMEDSINLLKVKHIIDIYGWPGVEEAGRRGNTAVFLVIQHASTDVQQKYLPIMREAVKSKKADANQLAMLEDRVAINTGHKQVYGSQIGRTSDGEYYVAPMEDPENVDKRRAEVGLGPLSEYVSNWQLDWNAAKYKKDLPELEKKIKTHH